MNERRQDSLLGLGGSLRMNLGYSLPVFLGDTTRRRDAKVVTLVEGQDLESEDITIPVSKLHAVRGALLDAGTGQAMNGGNVALKYTDTGEEVASVKIDPDTRTFTFNFIPEGTYSLESKNGHEMRLEQLPGSDEMQDPFGMFKKEVPLRWYIEGQSPLLVQGETNGANLALKPRAAQAP